jgi:hypothetical protein
MAVEGEVMKTTARQATPEAPNNAILMAAIRSAKDDFKALESAFSQIAAALSFAKFGRGRSEELLELAHFVADHWCDCAEAMGVSLDRALSAPGAAK